MKNKFLSRKFILSALVVIGGIGTSLGTIDNPVAQIVGIIVACVTSVVYSAVEGEIDASAVRAGVDQLLTLIEKIQGEKDKDLENLLREVNDNDL